MKFIAFLKQYRTIVFFLILEVLALVSFTFGNINEVFYLITTILTICAFVFSFFTNVDKKQYLKMIPIVAGLFAVSGIAAFGGLSKSFTTFSNIATFFALPSFFSLGFFVRRIGYNKIEHVLLAIGFGLAAITLFGTVITWVQYGPFYTLIYKDTPTYFYEGTAYLVTKEMGWLMGFKITEVSIEYGGMFAILCSVFLPALLFIKLKQQKKLFICSSVIGGIGLVSLISIPNFKALILLVLVSIFAFVYRFLKEKKLVVKILSIVGLVIICVGALFYLMSIINGAIGFKFTGFLEKLFVKNNYMKASADTLKGAFAKDINGSLYNLFGFDLTNSAAPLVDLASIVAEPTYIFEYEIIKEIGLIGTAVFVAVFVTLFIYEIKYIMKSKDSSFMKNVVIMMLLAFFLYASVAFNIKSQPHNQNVYNAFLRSVPFMIVLFLLGFTYCVPEKEDSITVDASKKVEDVSL